MCHQRPADRQHLLLTTGEIAGSLVPAFFQRGEVAVDHLDIAGDLTPIAAGISPGDQVLFAGEMFKHPSSLHHLENARLDDLLCRGMLYRFTEKFDRAIGYFSILRL